MPFFQSEITASLTNIFQSLPKQQGVAFIHGCDDHPYSRYQYLAWNPHRVFSGKSDPKLLEDFRQVWKEEVAKWDLPSDLETPFNAGCIGYLGYDLKDTIEQLPSHAQDDLQLPDIYFCFYDHLCVHDRETGQNMLYARSETVGEEVLKFIQSLSPINEKTSFTTQAPDPSSSMTRTEYGSAFQNIKQALEQGRIYQINLAQRLEMPCQMPGDRLFLELLASHPAPYASYLHTGEMEVVSISPERFVNVYGKAIETCPIKGTAKRGGSPEEDAAIKKSLLDSIKEDAELSMIVDLERNDLGKICEWGTVEVPKHREPIAYHTLWQIVSTVRGTLREGIGPFEVIQAMFPGGSVTGTPKIEAMKLIEELEPVKRGLYTGSIGWIDYSGNMDFSIVIRTVILKNNTAYLHVGGGIVMDSEEEKEYDETWLKAKALLAKMS